MFTGLIECEGRVRSIRPDGDGRRLTIEAPFCNELTIGESVNVDGACQSVVAMDEATFTVTAVPETLRRTKMGNYRDGVRVNLERSLRPSDRLGGHLVTGHIDCVGRVSRVQERVGDYILAVDFPPEYAPLVVEKGSVGIDGVSLTVVGAERSRFTVALIPHTRQATTVGSLRTGDHVNLEFDLVGKYLLRYQHLADREARQPSWPFGG